MRVLRALLIGSLLIGLLPGVVELGEDLLHVALEGHSLHASDHDGEDGEPSHGCDDCTHCVSCHGQGTPFVAAVRAQVPNSFAVGRSAPRASAVGDALDGVRARLDRPPQS